MISRPILTKEIKLNGQVYNLELYSPASDAINDDFIEEPPTFRREFFNEMGMSGQWPAKKHVDKYQERFDDWFDKLPPGDQLKYAKSIDESNRIIIGIVWDLLLPQDKEELFNDNIRSFSNWFSALQVSDVDFYMSRIMGRKRVMPTILPSDESLTEQEISEILEQVYDNIDDDLIRATTINGLLCISCSDESRLKKAKSHMIKHGSILRDYRKKQNSRGSVIYTYIFSKP